LVTAALEDAVQDEELLHVRGALADQRLALSVLGDLELRLQIVPGGRRHFAQNEVLLELQPDRVALWMIDYCRHGRDQRGRAQLSGNY